MRRSVYIVLLVFAVACWMLAAAPTEGYIDWDTVKLDLTGCLTAKKQSGSCPRGMTWDKTKSTCSGCESMGSCTYNKRTKQTDCTSPFGNVSYNANDMKAITQNTRNPRW